MRFHRATRARVGGCLKQTMVPRGDLDSLPATSNSSPLHPVSSPNPLSTLPASGQFDRVRREGVRASPNRFWSPLGDLSAADSHRGEPPIGDEKSIPLLTLPFCAVRHRGAAPQRRRRCLGCKEHVAHVFILDAPKIQNSTLSHVT
jgi:hypothetical protein